MGKFVAMLAQFGERMATPGQQRVCALLRLLCRIDCRLDRRDLFAGSCALPPWPLPRRAPPRASGHEAAALRRADLVGQLAIALGCARLPAQRRGALFLVAKNFVEPREIGLGRAQLLLGILAADVQARDAGGFLQHCRRSAGLAAMTAPIRPWLTSAGECAPVAASANSKRDVLGADVAAVDAVGRAGAALDPADDLAFASAAVVAAAARSSRIETSAKSRGGRVAVPAKITSSMPPPRSDLGLELAHRPADRFEQVGLAAAVGADDAGQAGLDPQLGRLDEALEAAELEPSDAHSVPSPQGHPSHQPP